MSIDIEILTNSKITNFSKIAPICKKLSDISKSSKIISKWLDLSELPKMSKKMSNWKTLSNWRKINDKLGKKLSNFCNGLEWSQLELDPNPDADCQSVLTCCWEAALLLRDKIGENQAPRNIYRNKRGP